jgi:hypothetical protein
LRSQTRRPRLVERSIRVAKALDARTQEVLGAPDLALLKALLIRTLDAEDQFARS